MPRKMARSGRQTPFGLAEALMAVHTSYLSCGKAGKSANIRSSSGVIRGIPAKKLSTYLIGNPVLANRMFEQRPDVGLYAPLRVAIYEDDRGTSHFTYDRPTSILAQFEDGRIQAVAKILDQKMASLAEYLAQ